MLNEIMVLNIRDFLSAKDDKILGEEKLHQLLSEFSCEKNMEVEKFLKEDAIETTEIDKAVTYLVFTKKDVELVGYFTIRFSSITVNAENLSQETRDKIGKVYGYELEEPDSEYSLVAFLIVQLGKNYTNDANKKITGEQLLQAAMKTLEKLQDIVGGRMVYLESQNEEKLIQFFEKNEFKRFGTRKENAGTKDEHELALFLKVM